MPLIMLKFHVPSMKLRKSLISLAFITPKLMLAQMIACCTMEKTKTKKFVRNVMNLDGKEERRTRLLDVSHLGKRREIFRKIEVLCA